MSADNANATDPAREGYLAQNRSTTTLVSIWAVTGAAFVFTLARLYVKGCMRRNLQNDDLFIILSMAASISSCALTSKAVAHGLGHHVEALSHDERIAVTTWTYIAFCPGVMSFAIPKLAVIALLVRLLSPRKPHYMFLWAMGITVQLTLLATIGILIRVLEKQCPPFNDVTVDPPAGCVSVDVQVKWCLFAGSLSAFVDFYLAIYPSIVLCRLQMRWKKKLALSVALGLGVLSGAVAVYKTTQLPALADPDFPCQCHPSSWDRPWRINSLRRNRGQRRLANMDSGRGQLHRHRVVDPHLATAHGKALRGEPNRVPPR